MKKTIKFLLLGGLVFVAAACESGGKNHSSHGTLLADVKVVNEVDPICGMSVSEHLKDTLTYEKKLYGFCSSNCKEKFKENPKNFVREK
ncbi:MAG: YHS domain-containing protein [Flavobacteriaceae bacterium]|jgi:YHS domain-containing protein|nr:YHS domain-containing protein [Flavobacteriaceae bacterium]